LFHSVLFGAFLFLNFWFFIEPRFFFVKMNSKTKTLKEKPKNV